MPTTIQISDLTRQRLGILKERMQAKSYGEVVDTLLNEKLPVESMFGSAKGLGPWKKERWSKYD